MLRVNEVVLTKAHSVRKDSFRQVRNISMGTHKWPTRVCIDCGKDCSHEALAYGRCDKCYRRWRYANDPIFRAKEIERNRKVREMAKKKNVKKKPHVHIYFSNKYGDEYICKCGRKAKI